jgi:hypothetical protein
MNPVRITRYYSFKIFLILSENSFSNYLVTTFIPGPMVVSSKNLKGHCCRITPNTYRCLLLKWFWVPLLMSPYKTQESHKETRIFLYGIAKCWQLTKWKPETNCPQRCFVNCRTETKLKSTDTWKSNIILQSLSVWDTIPGLCYVEW